MNEIAIEPSMELTGKMQAPSSKAYTHRTLVASALTNGHSKIYQPLRCDDSEATMNAIQAYGAIIKKNEGHLTIIGRSTLLTPEDVINCGESGATIRFMTSVGALAPGISILTGQKQLRQRPIEPLIQAMRELGVTCYTARQDGNPPVVVFGGSLNGGKASIRGDISSQFVSGLLFAAPLAQNDVNIHLTSSLESRYYVSMTIEVMNRHGIEVGCITNQDFHIDAGQDYKPTEHNISGDYSSAAFILSAAAITKSEIIVERLENNTIQGDIAILDILSEMGAEVKILKDSVEIRGETLNGLELSAEHIPDLVPIIAVLGCYAQNQTVIHNTGRLRIKESNRLSSLTCELGKMGASIQVNDDTMIVKHSPLKGTLVNPHNDHRIAMACSIAALGAKGTTIIKDAKCVSKSYANFYNDLRKMGVKLHGR